MSLVTLLPFTAIVNSINLQSASLIRPGIQALISDGTRGRFRFVLTIAMDRLSRDLEDIAGLYKSMAYSDEKIVTLSEGEVTHLQVGINVLVARSSQCRPCPCLHPTSSQVIANASSALV
jgi:hypothetical protein